MDNPQKPLQPPDPQVERLLLEDGKPPVEREVPERTQAAQSAVAPVCSQLPKPTSQNRPSVFFDTIGGLADKYWEWLGLKSVGEEMNTHREKVRVMISIISCSVVFCGMIWFLKGCLDDSKIETVQDQLHDEDKLLGENRGRSAFILADSIKNESAARQSENALAPWKQLANSKFPTIPNSEALTNVLKLLSHEIPNLPTIYIRKLEGLPPEKTNDANLMEVELLVRNLNDVELDNFCSRLQMPEPIVETPEKPEKLIGTQIEWRPLVKTNVLVKGASAGRNDNGSWLGGGGQMFPQYVQPCFYPDGNRGIKYSFMAGITSGVWELQVDKIPPGGYVLIRFITSNSHQFNNYLSFANAPLWSSPPNQKPSADTNELRFYFEGQYQFQSEIKPGTQHFFVPILFDAEKRTLSSLPAQLDIGHWHPVTMQFE